MSIKAVILSLPRDIDRRNACEAECTQLGLSHSFFNAIYGDQLSDADVSRVYDAKRNRRAFKRPLSRNEIACALGHLEIWQAIAEAEDALTLVLEDDATFIQNPMPFLDALSESSGRYQNVMIKLDGVAGSGGQVLGSVADQSLILSDRLPPRTTGYVIGRKAAAHLTAVHAPFARPVDIDLKFYWEHQVPILTLAHQMVSERGTFESTIEANRNSEKVGSALGRFLSNALYQIRYSYGRLSHPLKPAEIAGLAPLLDNRSGAQDRS